jgi:superfamily II DNA or RNA helicase
MTIKDDLLYFKEIYNDFSRITDSILVKFDYPNNIKDLIKKDFILFNNFITFYTKDTLLKITNNNVTYNEIINNIPKIKNYEYIVTWLINMHFFDQFFENVTIINVNELVESNSFINNFKLRINQIDAFDKLDKDGLVTGIHNQATGCGKSIIIIKYIDYANNHINNPKIILFTERINILKDLFDFTKGTHKPNINKIKEWKDKNIANLTNFEFINAVTIKNKKWVNKLTINKPILVVINRSFLTSSEYKKINHLDLILHDECHNTTSDKCHEFLTHFTKNKIPIIGFSATPIRTHKNSLLKLLEIYHQPDNKNKLNILTNYNMIYSISNDLIVPPEFIWFQIESYNDKDNKNKISDVEVGSILDILDNIVNKLPFKKIICWCRTIEMAKLWKIKIESNYKLKRNLTNFNFGLDTSESTDEDYKTFKTCEGNMILFCAAKHREGSDIKNLDCCIFLDKTKDRNEVPFIQSIGRVLRKTENKYFGLVIDGYIKDNNNYEKELIDKIVGYYVMLNNLSLHDSTCKLALFNEILNNVKFNKEQKIIQLNIKSKIYKIHCIDLKWDDIIEKFYPILETKLNISKDESLNLIIKKLKLFPQFNNPENDFWKEYEKIDYELLGIPKNIYNEYKEIFDKNTWYDLLGLKDNFYNYQQFIKLLKNHPKLFKYYNNWYTLNNNILNNIRKYDNKIPPNCIYYYKIEIEQFIKN